MHPVLLEQVAAARHRELRSAGELARAVRSHRGPRPSVRVVAGAALVTLGQRLAGTAVRGVGGEAQA